MGSQSQSWQDIVARKKVAVDQRMPQEWLLPQTVFQGLDLPLETKPNDLIAHDIPRQSGLLTPRELEITENYDVTELLKRLRQGAFTALEVTIAFSKRAAIAQQLTSCLTETFFADAQERAKQLDEDRLSGKTLGALHGLPISIKDSVSIKGLDSTIGYVSLVDKPAEKNTPMVDLLYEAGAVLFVKTNVPQAMLTADSQNNIFGRTLNPHRTSCAAGGSSGGESALIAFRGSLLGIGSDMLGSIRVPAAFCGVYGFKPSADRLPYGGQVSGLLPGFRVFHACAGPLAVDMEGLEAYCKAIVDIVPSRLDVSLYDIPWRNIGAGVNKAEKKLTIGVFAEDPSYPIHPPQKRALKEAADRLASQGHNIVPLTAAECRLADCTEVAYYLLGVETATPASYLYSSGEPVIPSYKMGLKLPDRGQLKFVPDTSDMGGLHRWCHGNVLKEQLQEHWTALWHSKRLDVVLAPGSQCTAVPHDTFRQFAYTSIFNLLDYPACNIPFSKASAQSDPVPLMIWDSHLSPNYIPGEVDGLPCSLQIVTTRMRDEECLLGASIVDACLNPRQ